MKNHYVPFLTLFFIASFALSGYSQEKVPCSWNAHLTKEPEEGKTMRNAVYKLGLGTVTIKCLSRTSVAKGDADPIDASIDQAVAALKQSLPGFEAHISPKMNRGAYGKEIYDSGAWGYFFLRVFATSQNVYLVSATGPRGGQDVMNMYLNAFEITEAQLPAGN